MLSLWYSYLYWIYYVWVFSIFTMNYFLLPTCGIGKPRDNIQLNEHTHKYEATIFKQIVVEQSKLKTEWDIIHILHIFLHIILRQSNGNRFEWCRTNKMWISFALVSCNLWCCLLASKLVLLNIISEIENAFVIDRFSLVRI